MAYDPKREFFTEEEEQAFDLFLDEIRKDNIESATRHEPVSSLGDILDVIGEELFETLFELHGNDKDLSALSKPEAKKIIVDSLSNPELLESLLLYINTALRRFFEKAVDAGCSSELNASPDIALILQNLGLVFMFHHEDALHFCVADEVKAAYEQIKTPEFDETIRRNDIVDDYLYAAVNLYGAIHFDDLLSIINKQNDFNLEDQDFFDLVMKEQSQAGGCFLTDDDYIAHANLDNYDDEELLALIEESASKPRFLPPRDILLRYAEAYYFDPTPEADMLEVSMNMYFPDQVHVTEDILFDIQSLARQGAQIGEVLDMLEDDYGIDLTVDIERYEPLFQQIVDVINSTRMWPNNGRTPKELFAMSGM